MTPAEAGKAAKPPQVVCRARADRPCQNGPVAERTPLAELSERPRRAIPRCRRSADRSLLPAIEPDRRIDDWGRSERVEERLRPHRGRVLLPLLVPGGGRGDRERARGRRRAARLQPLRGAASRRGDDRAGDPRGALRSPRPLNITVEHFFKGYPLFSMLAPKIGCVAAHPANVHRLLHDERSLVLVFPEGRKGTEKVYSERYRLRRFGRGGFVAAAMRARAKLVPVCVVGAEEAAPIFAQVGLMKKLTGLLYFPLTPTFPWLGPAGMLGYLPAKFRIRFLEPIDTAELGQRPRRRAGAGADGRPGGAGPDPGEPARDARRAGSRSGSDDRSHRPRPQGADHRPGQLLGRPARRGARVLPRGRGDHRGRPGRADPGAAPDRVREGRHPALADRADRQGRRRSTP